MSEGMATASEPLALAPEAVRETHCSRVLLQGDKAYKLRKPVRFAFVDQSSVAARRALAAEEVRINQELAPGMYLGVADVRGLGGRPEPAVVMERFRDDDTLAARLSAGLVQPHDLERLGRRLAAFHAAAPVVLGRGGVGPALARADRNAEELAELLGLELGAPALWGVVRGLGAAILRNAASLDRRAAEGWCRDGHGDLRADHVLLGPRDVRIIDRLEFDAGLRADDVGSDLAFLLMDLEARDARWAADAVLAAYRAAGGDPGGDELLAVWSAYRATVAVKVALLWAAQTRDAGVVARAHARLALAGRLLWRARGPLALVVCGPPASGKSTVAAELAERTGLPVVATDLVRKELAGVAAHEPAPSGAYAAEMTAEVYDELGRRAAALAASAGGVIVDATMGTRAGRAALREHLGGLPALWVECRTPAAVATAWSAGRARAGGSASDADAAVAARLRASWQPLDDVPPARHLVVRADRPAAAVADDLERRLDGVDWRARSACGAPWAFAVVQGHAMRVAWAAHTDSGDHDGEKVLDGGLAMTWLALVVLGAVLAALVAHRHALGYVWRRPVHGPQVEDVMSHEVPAVSAELTVEEVTHGTLGPRERTAYAVCDRQGHAVGVLLREDLLRIPHTERPARLVGDIARHALVDYRAEVATVLEAPSLADAEAAVVVDGGRMPVGLLQVADLRRAPAPALSAEEGVGGLAPGTRGAGT